MDASCIVVFVCVGFGFCLLFLLLRNEFQNNLKYRHNERWTWNSVHEQLLFDDFTVKFKTQYRIVSNTILYFDNNVFQNDIPGQYTTKCFFGCFLYPDSEQSYTAYTFIVKCCRFTLFWVKFGGREGDRKRRKLNSAPFRAVKFGKWFKCRFVVKQGHHIPIIDVNGKASTYQLYLTLTTIQPFQNKWNTRTHTNTHTHIRNFETKSQKDEKKKSSSERANERGLYAFKSIECYRQTMFFNKRRHQTPTLPTHTQLTTELCTNTAKWGKKKSNNAWNLYCVSERVDEMWVKRHSQGEQNTKKKKRELVTWDFMFEGFTFKAKWISLGVWVLGDNISENAKA